MENATAIIEAYFDEVGLRSHRSLHQFWAYLDSKYGMARVLEFEKAYGRLETGDEEAFYSLIFQELETSIDFASLRIDLYRTFCNWLMSSSEASATDPPGIIVDAGCGNGILTAFLARLYPQARVIGFDINENAIARARELAARLETGNVEYVEADAGSDLSSLPVESESVDLIISVAALPPAELPEGPSGPISLADRCGPLRGWYDEAGARARSQELEALSPFLAVTGKLVSFDKRADTASQLAWAAAIEKAGLALDLAKCAWLSYEDIEADRTRLPLFSASPGGDETTKTEDARQTGYDELLAFLLERDVDLSSFELPFGQESVAETMFCYINPRTYIKGARAFYRDGSGIYWFELWKAGPLAIAFEHTNHGYRNIQLAPLNKLSRLEEAFDTWLSQTESYAEIKLMKTPEITF